MRIDLANCDPEIDDRGNLKFVLPGGIGSTSEITPWESGFEARATRSGRTRAGNFWTLRLFSDGSDEDYSPKVASFLERIPSQIRGVLTSFQFGQVPMLSYMARYPAARDLFVGNPNLLWLVVISVHDGLMSSTTVGDLCRAKQVDILRKITWPVSKGTLRLLRKTVLQDGTLGESRALGEAIRNIAVINATAHEKRVTLALLTLLGRYPVLVRRHFVSMLNRHFGLDHQNVNSFGIHVAETIADIERLAVQLRIYRSGLAIRQCRTIDDIHRLHDRWVARLNKLLRAGPDERRALRRARPPHELGQTSRTGVDDVPALPLRFPEQPFPNTNEIVAITTSEELRKEGQVQQNCVGSCAGTVASGKRYIYRVLSPQRATVEVAWTRYGWKLGQVKLARNGKPSQLTLDLVSSWFARSVGR